MSINRKEFLHTLKVCGIAVIILLGLVFMTLTTLGGFEPIIHQVTADDAWWDTDYAYRKAIWIDARTISENLEDFVVMVHIGGEFYWVLAQNDGDDIRFANATGTEYIYELSSWDYENDAFFWVKVPYITASSIEDNYFYMYYGNSTVSSAENPTAVWSEYVLVHHIEEAAGNIMDQTMYDNDGINENSFAYSKPGLVGECGKGDHEVMDAWYSILDQSGTELDFGTNNMTIEVVTKGQSDQSHVPGDESVLIYAKGDSGGDWELSLADNTGRADFWIYDGVNQPRVTGTTSMYTNNQGWSYIAAVRVNASKLYIYVNGTEEDNTVDTCGSIRNNPDYGFCGSPTPGSRGADGYYEEVRISNMSRSAEYIEAENMNLFGEFALWTIENRAVEITDMEGCGDWVFAQEKYYTFQADVFHASSTDEIDTVKIAFTDGVHWVNATYDHQTIEWSLDDGSDVVNIKAGTTASDGNLLTTTFPLFFKSGILDALDVDIWLWANATNAEYCYWKDMEVDYFNIYNLGGFPTLTTSNDAGRVIGGDLMELYAYNNSWAQADIFFRKLQGVHFYVRVEGNKVQWDEYESDEIEITYSMSFCPDGEDWIKGWKLVLTNYDTWIRTGWFGMDAFFIVWNASWYDRDSVTGGWNLTKSDTFSSFPVWNGTDNFYTSLWIDFWFNKVNASTVVGARVNSEYYGIYNTGSFIWSEDWEPYLGNTTQSMYFEDLKNTAGQIFSSRQIKMMNFTARVEQGANARNNSVILKDYDILNWKIAGGGMEGIDTPIFVASKMPSMPSSGFLDALAAALSGVFNPIIDAFVWAGLEAWGILVEFLDSIASWLGFPNAFSNFASYIVTLFSYVGTAMGQMSTMLTEIFTFFTGPIVLFLTFIGQFFSSVITTLTTMINIMRGVYGGGVDIITYFPIADLITLFFVFSVPVYLLTAFATKGIGEVWRIISTVMDVLLYFINLFIRVINFVINMISSLVEAIPVVE